MSISVHIVHDISNLTSLLIKQVGGAETPYTGVGYKCPATCFLFLISISQCTFQDSTATMPHPLLHSLFQLFIHCRAAFLKIFSSGDHFH